MATDTLFLHPEVDFHCWLGEPYHYGCLAKSDISKGALLAQIPLSECITAATEYEMADEIKRIIADDSDRFHPYVRNVVDSGSLEGLLSIWRDRNSEEKTSLNNVLNVMKYDKHVSFAYMLSRCFGRISGGMVSIPYGDMFNHSTLGWNTRMREDGDKFCFFAENDISAGSQIFNNYLCQGMDAVVMYSTHGFVDEGMDFGNIYILLSWLTGKENEVDDVLIKINVADPVNVLPVELLKCIPLVEFVPRLVTKLLLALDRFDIKSDNALSAINIKLVEQYRQRLIEYRVNIGKD